MKEISDRFHQPTYGKPPQTLDWQNEVTSKMQTKNNENQRIHGQRESKAVLEKQARLMNTPGFA